MLSLFFSAFTLVTAALLIRMEYRGFTLKNVFFKSMASLGFVCLGVSGLVDRGATVYAWTIVAGLVMGAAGDVLLALKNISPANERKLFLSGLFSFLLGHIFYTLAFMSIVHTPLWAYVAAIASAAAIFFLTVRIGCDYGRMKLPVAAYMLVICTMLLSAVLTALSKDVLFGFMITSGAALFLISDFILCLSVFHKMKESWHRFANLASYYAAQLLLALSILMV
jgi:uncharacterized membrane protein YhhN